ncbi:unnamed protein product [Ambrosiozyma monospora]|uniref:Unnamed protein product n=1 Tax=Ambrosiozyma monospora TaxID=43982 RepID=A0ACB5TPD7_AMBMO|nr:unnamed protein product [Ambrosiozyma monospora]
MYPINSNPTYLGVPLLEVDWKHKLDSLLRRVKQTLYMDLPVTLRVTGINTYIYSTIYYLNQHRPCPTELLTWFEDEVAKLLLYYLLFRPSNHN